MVSVPVVLEGTGSGRATTGASFDGICGVCSCSSCRPLRCCDSCHIAYSCAVPVHTDVSARSWLRGMRAWTAGTARACLSLIMLTRVVPPLCSVTQDSSSPSSTLAAMASLVAGMMAVACSVCAVSSWMWLKRLHRGNAVGTRSQHRAGAAARELTDAETPLLPR